MTASRQAGARFEFTLRPLECYAGTIDSDREGGDRRLRQGWNFECRCRLFERCATHRTRYRSVNLLFIYPLPETMAMESVLTIRDFDLTILERIVTDGTRVIHLLCIHESLNSLAKT